MSGIRQHILPRFLIKGFASRSENTEYFVWVYRKNQAPFESNIINVAVQKDFYSDKDIKADDLITEAETEYAKIINTLRSFNKSQVIKDELISSFIANMEGRTAHLRESLLDMSNIFLNEIIKYFQNTENARKFISSQIDKAIEKQTKLLNISRSKIVYINSLIRKERINLQSKIENQFMVFINNVLSDLFNKMPDIVKKAHLKAFQDSVAPKMRMQEYQKLKWNMLYFKNEYFILGDFGVLFEVESLKKYVTFWEKGEKIKNVFLPISNNHLLIGSNSEINNISNTNWLNKEIAEHSREYLLSSRNNSAEQNLTDTIGIKAQWITEKEIISISNELFKNTW